MHQCLYTLWPHQLTALHLPKPIVAKTLEPWISLFEIHFWLSICITRERNLFSLGYIGRVWVYVCVESLIWVSSPVFIWVFFSQKTRVEKPFASSWSGCLVSSEVPIRPRPSFLPDLTARPHNSPFTPKSKYIPVLYPCISHHLPTYIMPWYLYISYPHFTCRSCLHSLPSSLHFAINHTLISPYFMGLFRDISYPHITKCKVLISIYILLSFSSHKTLPHFLTSHSFPD